VEGCAYEAASAARASRSTVRLLPLWAVTLEAIMEFPLSQLESIQDFTINLARKAGQLILQGSKEILASPQSVNEKKNSVDLVTEWDLRVERLVQDEIRAKYPDFKFIGEESYSAGDEAPITKEPTFCVDPIDGTTNFVHGFPFVCISIGFILNGKPTLGVIYNPFLDELYHGITGQGSFLTRNQETQRLPLSPPRPLKSLSEALIAVEWGSDRGMSIMEKRLDSLRKLAGDPAEISGAKMAHSMRNLGSAALNFAMVASGRLDIYWEIGCFPWDVSAGIVIAQEAGGFVSGSAASPHDGAVGEAILTGRKYIVVRAIAEDERHKQQIALVKDLYKTVTEWDAT